MADYADSRQILETAWRSLAGDPSLLGKVRFEQPGALPCHFLVADLAAGSMAAAGLAVAELVALQSGHPPEVVVNRALAAGWFHTAIEPAGWAMPPFWHPLCADYRARDGWIRLHTNIPSHTRAVVETLGAPEDAGRAAAAVATWRAEDLESAVLQHGGAAARMRSRAAWIDHPQGRAAQLEELVHMTNRSTEWVMRSDIAPQRPLAGVRVLDLTRGVAGPVATRCLAAYGADVLRIDPPGWEEPAVIPDVVLGKRRARLDLRSEEGRIRLRQLVSEADVVVHGYRPGALDWLALDREEQDYIPAGLIDVTLNAYGWSGPWIGRRGFDSLVQMSSGMAEEAMIAASSNKPVHLPMQALDQGTGYLMAASAIRALAERYRSGMGHRVRCSLARTAELLMAARRWSEEPELPSRSSMFITSPTVSTGWGPAKRLPVPIAVGGAPMTWDIPAGPLGSHVPIWRPRR
jgi:crotonobetainyl-CoA:carnitine CoA-transferase CaiB-like acyl-CoA transferase